MRKALEKIFGEELRVLAIGTREKLELTQREMGDILQMSESSYSDIETGRSHCGMVSTILLLELQEDPDDFIQRAKEKANLWYEKEMQLI